MTNLLAQMRAQLPTASQATNYVLDHGKDLALSTGKVAGACLVAASVVELATLSGVALPAAFALEGCGTCMAVTQGTSAAINALVGSAGPCFFNTTVVTKSLEALAGLGLFFAKDIPKARNVNWSQVRPRDVLAFVKDQAVDSAKSTGKVVGACMLTSQAASLLGPVAKMLPETGFSFEACAFCKPSTTVVSRVFSKVPALTTGALGKCLETTTSLGLFFQRETVGLGSKAFESLKNALPQKITGVRNKEKAN